MPRSIVVWRSSQAQQCWLDCALGQPGATQPTSAASSPTSGAAQAPSSVATQTPFATSAAALPACIVRPALTEGPYFVDEKINRFDVRLDPMDGIIKDGAPLSLTIHVSQSCLMLPATGTAMRRRLISDCR